MVDEQRSLTVDRDAAGRDQGATAPRGRQGPAAVTTNRRGIIAIVAGIVLVLAAAVVVVTRDGSEAVDSAGREALDPGPPGTTVQESTSPASADGRGFLVTTAEAQALANAVAAGTEPFASVARELVAEAEAAQRREPSPVNPLVIDGTEGDFVDDSADAYTLALAFAITGDRRYADAAARNIVAWSTVATSTSDTCVDDGSCNTSLVIGRVAPGFIFAADLIAPSGALDEDGAVTLRRWVRVTLLPAASQRTNNWGDAGTFFRLVATAYLDDAAGFQAAVAAWKEQADLIESDGEIPEETRRGRDGLQYSQEALLYKVASAVVAGGRGVDLWGYTGARGGTLEKALDLVAGSLERPEDWRWHDRVEVPSPAPMWELAAAHSRKPAYEAIVRRGRPFAAEGHSAIRWTTLAGGSPSD